MTVIDFKRIRPTPKSQSESFEAISTLLFHRSFSASGESEFVSIRGDGGDGGVEAYFRDADSRIHGVQAKYFFKLGAGEFRQIKDSLKTALANYPELCSYIIYLPFDLTGKKALGAKGKSETERFDSWKNEQESAASSRGNSLRIELFGATKIREQLLVQDPHGGVQRYWFDETILTESTLRTCLDAAKAFAGPRYTATLDVETSAHEALGYFGGTADSFSWVSSKLPNLAASFNYLANIIDDLTGKLTAAAQSSSKEKVEYIRQGLKDLADGEISPALVAEMTAAAQTLQPLMAAAEAHHYEEFCEKHGEEKDTQGFRQFHAEYMCNFPAANLDRARDAQRALIDLIQTLNSPAIRATSAQSLLLVGPAGVGKTHAIVSATEGRLTDGALSIILFGDDFEGTSPWEIIRSKLGFSSNVSRDELFECLEACSYAQGYPFLVFIDALNEGVMGAKWKDRLPEFLEQIKPYPGVKVCVSTRDTYKDLVVDNRFPGYAFTHPGFSGREFEALQHFARAYELHTEITPLFSEETANPLFLHLACRTLKAQGYNSLDLSLKGFVGLFEGYLELCNERIRTRLGFASPRNLVARAMQSLAGHCNMVTSGITWADACKAVEPILQGEETSPRFLEELRREGLVIITRQDNDDYLVRFGYQRYGDVLRCFRLIDSFKSGETLDIVGLGVQLATSDPGLLEVLATVLPESEEIELVDDALGLPKEKAHELFLQGLPWRSKKSITYQTKTIFRKCLRIESIWPKGFETSFKLSLVPGHPFNADWLSNELFPLTAATRDGYLWYALNHSYDDSGVVRSLIDAALFADLFRWPSESRRLAATTLSWLCSSPDRRVRDQSGKGLMRLIGVDVGLAQPLANAFVECDDEYVLESISGAVYCACLLCQPENRCDFVDVLDVLLMPGFDRPNVVIRNNIKLLAAAIGLDRLSATTVAKLSRYPTPVSLPTEWPTEEQAKAVLKFGSEVRNMDFTVSPIKPDFWRYQIERELRRFNLKNAGITQQDLAYWVMCEIPKLGFPGRDEACLVYDSRILHKHGPGRSRAGYAERLGKKYSWIAYHRLVGMLSDNLAPASDWSGATPDKKILDYSLRSRKADLTDVRDIATTPDYPINLLPLLRYPFSRDDDRNWLERHDLPSHTEYLIHKAANGVEWFVLSFSASDNQKSLTDDYNTPYRHISLDYKTVLASPSFNPATDRTSLEQAFQHDSYCYRAYFAEYPREAAFKYCEYFGKVHLAEDGFTQTEVNLMRGNEWEYDYSWKERAENLSVPAPVFIEKLNLKWDRHSGWVDQVNRLAALHVRREKSSALFIRKDLMDKFLKEEDQVVYFRRFENRSTISGLDGGPSIDIDSLLIYKPDCEIVEIYSEKELFGFEGSS